MEYLLSNWLILVDRSLRKMMIDCYQMSLILLLYPIDFDWSQSEKLLKRFQMRKCLNQTKNWLECYRF